MGLELVTLSVAVLAVGAAVSLTGGLGRVFGGMIGKPDHEVVVAPEQEPVPVPIPILDPVEEVGRRSI